VAELTKIFCGTGTKQLGTIQVEVDSRIRYVVVPQGGIRITPVAPPPASFRNLSPARAL